MNNEPRNKKFRILKITFIALLILVILGIIRETFLFLEDAFRYLFPYWPSLVIVVIVIAIIIFIAFVFQVKKRDKIRNENHRLYVNSRLEIADQLRQRMLHEVLKDCLVIDSNIWMAENYDDFFVVLKEMLCSSGKKIELYGPQFDEICNIKNNYAFNEVKGRRSRLALNRIEDFQKRNLLTVEPIHIEADRNAYADPLILRLLISAGKDKKTICFITDDRELRIRAREVCRRNCSLEPVILEVQTLLAACHEFIKIAREGLVNTQYICEDANSEDK